MSNLQLPSAQINQIPYNVGNIKNPIINLRPSNPLPEEFAEMQKFGLNPYDRSPNDYLRFVANVFTAFRDPNDNILNDDPFDSTYGAGNGETTTTLQATADKSIVAYIDGFQAEYQFTRLTTDAASTDKSQADDIIKPDAEKGPSGATELITYINEKGEEITIDQAKYGEYHRFIIKQGTCFIDNQLIQIKQDTEWWFRVPEVKELINGVPQFELGQFITDQIKVYSLLPNKNYNIILSYQYITQFESNYAQLQFVTDITAIDSPYLLLASFSTNEYGMVHQTQPVNEHNIEKYKNYITKLYGNEQQLRYFLRDINPQYLDKKYMQNHKNLFKNLQSQLLTVLTESKLSNTFSCREIKEDIDHSVSSGDFVYYNANKNRWYPAEVSRSSFDKVVGLYLKNATEGTDFVFFNGIIEIDDTWTITDSKNLVLKNLIPSQEYFLADDITASHDVQPFIDVIKIDDTRDLGTSSRFSITTNILAKADRVEITFKNKPGKLSNFSLTKSFELDAKLGEQRVPQAIFWELTLEERSKIPNLKNETGTIATENLLFDFKLFMVQSEIQETKQTIINQFKLSDTVLTVPYTYFDTEQNKKITKDIDITASSLNININNLPDVLIGPRKPIINMLEAIDAVAPKDYPDLNIDEGDFFQVSGLDFSTLDTRNELQRIALEMDTTLYNTNPNNLGLNDKLGLLGDYLTQVKKELKDLEEALQLQSEQMRVAKIEFQSTATELQENIKAKRNEYLIAKNAYDTIVSRMFALEQKRNELRIYIDTLIAEREKLSNNVSETNSGTSNTNDLIFAAQNEVKLLQAEVTRLQELLNKGLSDIGSLLTKIKNTLNSLFTNKTLGEFSNFKDHYYNVLPADIVDDTSKDNPANNEMLLRQRLLYNFNESAYYIEESEKQKPQVDYYQNQYTDLLKTYTNDLLYGTSTTAQQIIQLEAISQTKERLTDEKAKFDSLVSKVSSLKEARMKLRTKFLDSFSKPIAELFCLVQDSADPTWTGTPLVTYTVKLNRAHNKDLNFKFIFREDTAETMIINIPAGGTTASISIFQKHLPDTNIDNGITKWIAYESGVSYNDKDLGYQPVFNLNKFNEQLRNDARYLGYDPQQPNVDFFGTDTSVYSIDPVAYAKNPNLNIYRGKVKNVNVLTSLNASINTLLNDFMLREETLVDIASDTLTLENTQANLHIKTNILEALKQQKNLGQDTVDNYQTQITVLNDLIWKYTNDTDPIRIDGLPHLDMSLVNINTDLANLEVIKQNKNLYRVETLNFYQDALKLLEDKTDEALGSYITTIAMINELIASTKENIIKIETIFNIYHTKVQLVINIHNNINSLLSSGVFVEAEETGIWSTLKSYLLNRFEYQEAMTNILIETFNFLIDLGTIDNVLIPEILEFTTGINGLSHPQDLTPWIFSKGSGKITTRQYPGATSVGIALNQNTLILNIQTNKRGDISEFLNVYGNANDFIAQFERVYNSVLATSNREDSYTAILNVDKKLSDLGQRLSNPINNVTRTINGISRTFQTSLTANELNTLDYFLATSNRRELLYRLIFMKYFSAEESDTKNIFNPCGYLFMSAYTKNDTQNYSRSSYYSIGNPNLNLNKDILSDIPTQKTFIERTTELMTATSGLNETIMKGLFSNKISLYKDKDILNYIISALQEPLINYTARALDLEQDYTKVLQFTLDIERLNLADNPTTMDPFENPVLSLEEATKQTNALKKSGYYDNLIATTSAKLSERYQIIDTKLVQQNASVNGIVLYQKYRTFYMNLLDLINPIITLATQEKLLLMDTKNKYNTQIEQANSSFLSYYKMIDKLPNTMWDIFRVTNFQRTKYNYTYLVLRISSMQKELINTIVNNNIQYSPVNSELNELRVKKNTALANDKETEAFAYQTLIDALETSKTQFLNLLQNYIDEFNEIQRAYNKTVITKEIPLTEEMYITELYMQDPDEYDLEYASYPFEKLPSGL